MKEPNGVWYSTGDEKWKIGRTCEWFHDVWCGTVDNSCTGCRRSISRISKSWTRRLTYWRLLSIIQIHKGTRLLQTNQRRIMSTADQPGTCTCAEHPPFNSNLKFQEPLSLASWGAQKLSDSCLLLALYFATNTFSHHRVVSGQLADHWVRGSTTCLQS